MKCSELFRLLKKDGWYPVSQKGSPVKLGHDKKKQDNHFSTSWESGIRKMIGEED